MNLNFETNIDFSEESVQKFIFKDSQNLYSDETIVHQNFIHDEQLDRRLNKPNEFEKHFEKTIIMVEEEWAVDKNGVLEGINKVIVALGQNLNINVAYNIYYKNELSSSQVSFGRKLLKNFNFTTHGNDIKKYILNNLNTSSNPGLKEEDFIFEISTVLEKEGEKYEVNIDQRQYLLDMYGEDGKEVKSKIHVGDGEGEITRHILENNLKIRKIGERLLLGQNEPQINRDIIETETELSSSNIDFIVDGILAEIVPVSCGDIRKKEKKIMTLFSYPEIRIKWKKKRIKIGCSKVTIKYPIVQTRTSKVILYVYYSLPKKVASTLLAIAEACAIRAALGGSVIGIVLYNPGAAIASFRAIFRRCIEREIKNCFHGGIFLNKVKSKWS